MMARITLGFIRGNLCCEELAKMGFQGVADPAERGEFPFSSSGRGAGIGDAPVNPARRAGKDGAALGGGIADRYHRIKALAVEFGDGFRALARDVDANLAHRLDGQRTHTNGFGSGTVNFVSISAKMTEQAFSHLAAHGVAGAKDEDSSTHRSYEAKG